MKKQLFEIGAKFEDSWTNKHNLTISKEKRRGKVVTIVKKSLLKTLKSSIEIQGEVELKVKELLQKMEYKFKK